MTRPEITYIVTGCDVSSTIDDAVRSALGQHGSCIEVVYVDDGSADSTLDRVEAVGDPRLRVIRQSHAGRAQALNVAVDAARSSVLAILDADDVALPLRARLQLQYLKAHPRCVAVGGQLLPADRVGRIDRSKRLSFPTNPSTIDTWIERGRMPIAHPAMTFRRSWFEETGGYDGSAKRAEDFDLVLRGWRPGRYAALSDIVTVYRSDLFPTWKYWRREHIYSRAVHRRWQRGGHEPVVVDSTKRDLARDLVVWALQRAWYAAERRVRPEST